MSDTHNASQSTGQSVHTYPVDWSSNPSVVGSQQLHIASVDSAANEYQPSGSGGALHQSDVLARRCDTPKSLHIIEKGISSCGKPH